MLFFGVCYDHHMFRINRFICSQYLLLLTHTLFIVFVDTTQKWSANTGYEETKIGKFYFISDCESPLHADRLDL